MDDLTIKYLSNVEVMGSNSPMRLLSSKSSFEAFLKVEFSSGFHSITKLMLSDELFMVSLGYNGYINMYFNLIMVNCDDLV